MAIIRLTTIDLSTWGNQGETTFVGSYNSTNLQLLVSPESGGGAELKGYWNITYPSTPIFGAIGSGPIIREVGALIFPRSTGYDIPNDAVETYFLYVYLFPYVNEGFLTVQTDDEMPVQVPNWGMGNNTGL